MTTNSGGWASAIAGGVIGAAGALALAATLGPKLMGERLVRETLVDHPDILIEASDSLRDKQYAPVLAANRRAIETPFHSSWRGSAKPDVVLAYTIKPVIWGTLAVWFARVPRRVVLIEGLGFVFTDSGSSVPLKRRLLRGVVSWLYRFALAHAHRVLMLNPDDIRDFATRGLVAPEKALNIGGIGVDLAEWPVVPLPDGPMTFCLAARLLREKGVYEYIEAARGIKARHPEARFLLLGSTDKNPGSLQAEEVAQWVREALGDDIPMWTLNLGRYVEPCIECEDADTSWQRPFIVIAVRKVDDGTHISEALADAMSDTINLPSPDRYSTFAFSKFTK